MEVSDGDAEGYHASVVGIDGIKVESIALTISLDVEDGGGNATRAMRRRERTKTGRESARSILGADGGSDDLRSKGTELVANNVVDDELEDEEEQNEGDREKGLANVRLDLTLLENDL